jgi:hypothetical protein
MFYIINYIKKEKYKPYENYFEHYMKICCKTRAAIGGYHMDVVEIVINNQIKLYNMPKHMEIQYIIFNGYSDKFNSRMVLDDDMEYFEHIINMTSWMNLNPM